MVKEKKEKKTSLKDNMTRNGTCFVLETIKLIAMI